MYCFWWDIVCVSEGEGRGRRARACVCVCVFCRTELFFGGALCWIHILSLMDGNYSALAGVFFGEQVVCMCVCVGKRDWVLV